VTTQAPDSVTFEGRKWVIESVKGDWSCVPSNESLGFRTVSAQTDNWAGRIDHFLIWFHTLLLFKVEVTLHPEDVGILPFGSRREIVMRYDQVELWDNEGMRMEQRLRQYEYLVFDDVEVAFSGSLALSWPYFDYWEVPWPISDKDEMSKLEAVAKFEDGQLIEWRESKAKGD
jgi:hypothetical protein